MSAGAFLSGLAGGYNTGEDRKDRKKELDALEQMASRPPMQGYSGAQMDASGQHMSLPPFIGDQRGSAGRHRRSTGGGSAAGWDPSNMDPRFVPLLLETADELGVNPEDVATLISFETAGTFDPRKQGPKTQHGVHEGLIQFGQPQQKRHGVDWNDPLGSQLGKNGAIVSYMRGAGVQAGMGLREMYAAVNTGSVHTGHRSDAHNGGTWGSANDKVKYQMDGHRAKAAKLLAHYHNNKMPPPPKVAAPLPVQGRSVLDDAVPGTFRTGTTAKAM